jgi:hypothetical protein
MSAKNKENRKVDITKGNKKERALLQSVPYNSEPTY